jgi:carboxymethylenebutenolidase
MTRSTANDFDPRVLQAFDQYVHGQITRRGFLERTAQVAGSLAAAAALLASLQPRFAEGQQVPPNDPRLHVQTVDFDSPHGYGKARGYLARPAGDLPKLPVILVVHENRGLNPHIEDITRRLALERFIAFSPDALFPLGGYPGDEDKARDLFGKLDQDKTHQDFLAAAQLLESWPQGTGRLGAVGFCYGGGIVNFLATRLPELAAAVPFYGGQPTAEETAKIKAPLLLHYAGADDRVNAGWPAYEAALKAAGVHYQAFIYPGVQHGFNNDTTPRYDAAAAKLAWQRTVDFFNAHLRG